MSALLEGIDPAMILAAAAELRMNADQKATYRATPIGRHVGRYLDELAFNNYSDKTFRNRQDTLGLLALDYANLEVAAVTFDHLKTFLADRWRDAAPNTKAQHVSSLRTFFAWCEDNDLIKTNPARKLKAPRAGDSTRQAHTLATVRKLLVGQPTLRDKVGVLLLYWCALRRNELRLVQWRHIDLANRTLTVFGKGSTVLEQNLPEPLALELERLILQRDPKPDEFLLHPQKIGRLGTWPLYTDEIIWEDRGRPLTVSGIDKWWQRCVQRAGLDHFPMHELRHTAGTHFHREGHDLVATQHFMRHRSAATTQRTYIHIDRVRAVAEVQRTMADPLDPEATA